MKVLVGLSGGVDSAIAAKLLIEAGLDVTACTMRLLPNSSFNNLKDDETIKNAKAIADKLKIKHIVYDGRKRFKERVINYFVNSYKNGLTPNPCYFCNSGIKFGFMLDEALKDGFDKIATGHYARLSLSQEAKLLVTAQNVEEEKIHLLKGKDKQKDQSYFLSCLTQHQLSHSLFPLGNLTKNEVKLIAKEAGLIKEEQKESQDICFVKDGEYATFIESFLQDTSSLKGDFVDEDGKKIKAHKGIHYYTIGQRRGLDIAVGYPIYVIKKSALSNTVTVGKKESLICHSLVADNLNIIDNSCITDHMQVMVRTRYRQIERPAYLTLLSEGKAVIEFASHDEGVATGQVVVFYEGEECLGSGIIKETFQNHMD